MAFYLHAYRTEFSVANIKPPQFDTNAIYTRLKLIALVIAHYVTNANSSDKFNRQVNTRPKTILSIA